MKSWKVPGNCGLMVARGKAGGILVSLFDTHAQRVIGRAVMTQAERQKLGAALLDEEQWKPVDAELHDMTIEEAIAKGSKLT